MDTTEPVQLLRESERMYYVLEVKGQDALFQVFSHRSGERLNEDQVMNLAADAGNVTGGRQYVLLEERVTKAVTDRKYHSYHATRLEAARMMEYKAV